jgi:uncharacterized membrane protein YgdD (TMEM256/DUF423 family)
MIKKYIQWGALFALLAVILGAFGAHGLQGKLTVKQLSTYHTAVQYQMYHAFALILAGILSNYLVIKRLKAAAAMFLAGIICFSGSLYLLACADLLQIGSGLKKVIGPITPLGGLFFIGGWLMVFIAGSKDGEKIPLK